MPIRFSTLIKVVGGLVILFGPFVVGAVPAIAFIPILIVILAVALKASKSSFEPRLKVTLAILATAFTITICDLTLRLVGIVPDVHLRKWPQMPLVNRYDANITFEGHRLGDLARMAKKKEWTEEKHIKLITDASGFRNDGVDLSRPLDVIILGDSFGAGGASQEDTWSGIFLREHQLNTYNLSAPASGPWQEYVNLWEEKGRLKTTSNTILIWQLFTGNDLDDPYGPMQLNALPRNGFIGGSLVRIDSFRARSPIRRLLALRTRSEDVLSYDFLNGRKLLFYKPYTVSAFQSSEQILRHSNFEKLRATIRSVKRIADENGWRLFIVLVPAKEEVYSWVWKQMPPWSTNPQPSGFSLVLKDLCAEESIRYLDLKPASVDASRRTYEQSGKLLYWYDDTHFNAEGSRFAASVIHDRLIKSVSGSTEPN